ncbi:hypothetical protein BDW22DRAFT_1433643 [Trametopsis cervina]|nr:hypothetical protein BDW22DRAFT_1433643 [Trametopsis cervina]
MSVSSHTSAWKTLSTKSAATLPTAYIEEYPLLQPSPAPPASRPESPGRAPPAPTTPTRAAPVDKGKKRARKINRAIPNELSPGDTIPPSKNFFETLSDAFVAKPYEGLALSHRSRTCELTEQTSENSPSGGPARRDRTKTINATSASLAGLPSRSGNPLISANARQTASGTPGRRSRRASIPWLTDADFMQVYGRQREGDDVTTDEAQERIDGINSDYYLGPEPTMEQLQNRSFKYANDIAKAERRLGILPDYIIIPADEAYARRAELARQIAIAEGRVEFEQPDEGFTQSPMPLSRVFPPPHSSAPQ